MSDGTAPAEWLRDGGAMTFASDTPTTAPDPQPKVVLY